MFSSWVSRRWYKIPPTLTHYWRSKARCGLLATSYEAMHVLLPLNISVNGLSVVNQSGVLAKTAHVSLAASNYRPGN